MIGDTFYKERIKSAYARALYVFTKRKYNSFKELAEIHGVTRQYMQQRLIDGMPKEWAGVLGRKHGLSPALFNYEDALILGVETPYHMLFNTPAAKKIFNTQDIQYILKGRYTKDIKKFLASQDNSLLSTKRSKE